MKLTIDEFILDKHGLTIGEFMLLYLASNHINITETYNNILAKGYADKDLFSENNLVVSDKIKDIISTIAIDSDKNVVDKDDEFYELADELREIYPAGRKEGTTYMWRGTRAEIAKKLKTLVVKYKYSFTKEQVIKAGGLKIIGSERHESRRIDNQLRGRAGRQGDVGESRFYISLEDDLMKLFGSDKVQYLADMLGLPEDTPIEQKMLTGAIETAQKRVEGRNYSIRKSVLEYDDVMNKQRNVIYSQRRQILDSDSIEDVILLITFR